MSRTSLDTLTMQINATKLQALERKARAAHVVLMDIAQRRSEARRALGLSRARWEVNLASAGPKTRREIEEKWTAADPSVVDGHWFVHLRQLDEQKAEVALLDDEYQEAEARYRGLFAPLPALRDFARRHGHRSPKTLVTVANAATAGGAHG